MNIAQVAEGELRIPVESGGARETLILSLSKQLSKMGHDVTILDRKYSHAEPSVEYIEGVKIVRLKARRFSLGILRKVPPLHELSLNISLALNQICFGFRVKKYLAEADFDIIQVHSSLIGLLLAVVSPNLRKKLFYTSHGSFRARKSLGLVGRIALALENQQAKRSRKVIMVNESLREEIIAAAKVNPEDVVVIPAGVDVTEFNLNLDVSDVRQKYGLDGKVTILSVGRIHPDKGVEYLVKAANIVVNEFGYNQVQFLLVGPIERFELGKTARSSYLTKILRLVEDYRLQQNVELTGGLLDSELKKLYSACDIFVLPSLAESGPRVVLEAMACGKPVIGTKVGWVPMVVKDGQSGFLIDPADEEQIADRIKHVIDNPLEAERMGTYGRKLAEEEFGWDKMAERYLQVYDTQIIRGDI